MEFESGQSGSRAMLFITSPWSAREKYKDPTVLSHFLQLYLLPTWVCYNSLQVTTHFFLFHH